MREAFIQSGADSPAPYLTLHHLARSFGSPVGPKQVVADVTLAIERRSFVAFVGPSGCGKSTLLRMVAGLLSPTSGEVCFQGRQVISPPFDLVYVFQQYAKSIFPWLTVLENTAFGLRNRAGNLPREDLRAQCRAMLQRVGLAGFESYFPWQLSGGMQQRVAIARALCCRPAALLLDEPFSAVDALTRAELQELMLQLWADFGLTVLFVTHDIEEAVYLSQKVVVLSPAPCEITDIVHIAIEYPRDPIRTKERPEYLEYRRLLLERLLTRRDAPPGAGP